MAGTVLRLLVLAALILIGLGGCGSEPPARATDITARMLVQPGALAGSGPENPDWSPEGARLTYTLAGGSGRVLWLYDASSGDKRILFDPADKPDEIDVTSAQWSPAGDAMLLAGATSLWVLEVSSGRTKKVAIGGEGALDAMMFTPAGTHVSYTRGNDLYMTRLRDGQVRRLTSDGSQAVFNGCLDWVYNEELATRAAQPGYAWSPDGTWLMYMRLDDSRVHNDPVTDYRPVPPTVAYTRYPTAGTPNPMVSLHCLAPDKGRTVRNIPLPKGTEYVLPFYTWAPDSSEIFYISVNRDHTILKLNAFDPDRGTSRTIIKEADPAWVNEDFYAAPVFLPDGKRFLWLSERSGFMHLYLYALSGELVSQLTDGDWLIDTTPYGTLTAGKPVHIDPSGTWAYFNTTATSPLERQLYRLNIDGSRLEQLSQAAGFHEAALS